LRFCMESSKCGKRVLRKEGERYDERNIISAVKWGWWWCYGLGMFLKRRFWAFRNYRNRFCRPRSTHQYFS
jgi:hypothetical protein